MVVVSMLLLWLAPLTDWTEHWASLGPEPERRAHPREQEEQREVDCEVPRFGRGQQLNRETQRHAAQEAAQSIRAATQSRLRKLSLKFIVIRRVCGRTSR